MTNRDVKPGPPKAPADKGSSADADTHRATDGAVLVAEIDAEMEGRERGYADRRGELLFRCRDALISLAPVPTEGHGVVGWQLIETAPRDGTRIMLANDTDRDPDAACIGWWFYGEWCDFGDIGCNGQCDYEPTHWMPLPPPPATATRNSGDEG